MYPGDRATMGRGDRLGQRYGLRAVMLYLIALGTIVGGLIVYGCSGDDNNNVQTRTATLNASQEVPTTGSAATGTITLNFSGDHSQINYTLVTVGPFSSPVTQAHIHIQATGVNGAIVLFFCTNLAPPANVPTPQPCPTAGGTISGTLTAADFIPAPAAAPLGVTDFNSALAQILSGDAYANVHTVNFPGGEIRAQITP